MNTQMKTLESYFSQAANRPLAFSEEQLRQMIQAHDAVAPSPASRAPRTGHRIARIVILGLLLGAAGLLFIGQSADDPPGSASSASLVSGSRPAATNAPSVSPEPGSPTEQLGVRSGPTVRRGSATDVAPPLRASSVQPPAMIDLGESDASAMGLRRLPGGRTAFAYYLVDGSDGAQLPDDPSMLRNGFSDSILVRTVSPQGLRDMLLSRADFPLGVVTRRASPIASSWQIVTDDEGRLLDSRVRPLDGQQLRALTALFARGLKGSELASAVDSISGIDAIGRELRLNTLLPIRVPLGSTNNPRAIFWCRADAELLAQLPVSAIDRLRAELEATASVIGPSDTLSIVRRGWALTVLQTLDSVRPQSMALDDALEIVGPDKLTGGEILGGSRRRGGSIVRFRPSASVVSGSVRLAIRLEQPRRVNLTLHDIQGRRMRSLAQDTSLDDGDSDLVISLDGIAKGLYLIALTSDRDEQVVQRIVIE